VVVVRGGVFINYRGADSRSYGALLHTELSRHFSPELVFLDSESIPAGADFVAQILGRVRRARVVLAVIGTQWLTATGPDGERRLDDPADWIRQELVAAFAAGVRVIPVLTDSAKMPTEGDLPADLAPLARCQYRRLRHRDASMDLARLVSELTTTDEDLAAAARRQGGVPQQLPAAVAHFAGRVGELATLTGLLRGRADRGGTVVISAVSGTAGVGKTALAMHWAHQVAHRFPDGQLCVNLRGFDPSGQVMAPAEAVRRFLDALQVPPERIPVDLDAQAALYRSQLAGKRMLVVLDNARDAGQVRPLLPGTPTALVLVTSRNRLSSLVAVDGAHPLMLDLLTQAEARELLARRLGPDRIATEPHAVEQIITCCARLPLALTIAAARAKQSGFPLATLASELDKASGRLDALDAGDPVSQVRTVFSWSYTTLSPAAARLFRLLGLHPGPDLSAAATASLAAVPPAATRRLLAELTRASLLTERTPGRYALHDLLRAYATDLTRTHDPADHRRAAVGRILGHYLHTAHTADRLLDPARDPITLGLAPPAPGVTPERPADHEQALAWLTAEHPVLLAAVRQAAEAGFDAHTWQLAWTLNTFFDRCGHWHDQTTTWQIALHAAGWLDDPAAQAYAHLYLARAHTHLGRYPDAHTHLAHALDLFTHTDNHTGQAHIHYILRFLWEQQGRPERALDCAQQSLTLYRAAGHRWGQAHALNSVGWCHALLGEHQQAFTYCQQALTLLQELGDRIGEAGTWDSLGYAHHHLGHHTQAADCYQHAVRLFRDLGDRYWQATILNHLGDTHHAAGNHDAARTAWTQALDILTDLDHPDANTVRAKLHDLDHTVTE
jgi:tetratricopeptide (TPR) repeat protein